MAIRVGTTAHDISSIRAASSEFEAFSGLGITSIAPDPIRPGDVVTITMPDTTLVHAVLFAGVAQTFAAPTGTTVTFTAPDGFPYGDKLVRVQEVSTAGREVLHSYQPIVGNEFIILAGYPPGLNIYGEQILHLGEGFAPQPENGMQLEVDSPAVELDFELYANASYSILNAATFNVRVIYADADASAWVAVTVQETGATAGLRGATHDGLWKLGILKAHVGGSWVAGTLKRYVDSAWVAA